MQQIVELMLLPKDHRNLGNLRLYIFERIANFSIALVIPYRYNTLLKSEQHVEELKIFMTTEK